MAEKFAFVDEAGLAAFKEGADEAYASKEVATATAAGLMSAEDKAKLDGLGGAGGDDFLTDEEFLAAVIS